MKRRLLAIALFLCMILIPSFHDASAEGRRSSTEIISSEASFILPSSLLEVEEGAFEETAVEVVVFSDGLVQIGEGAFRNAPGLTDVFIPKTAISIGDSAFTPDERLTIHGVKDSYAEDWAEEHKIPFSEDDIWFAIILNGRTLIIYRSSVGHSVTTVNPRKDAMVHERSEDETESKRPQDRPELNPIDYRFP